MRESFPSVIDGVDADKVHELTADYMNDIERGTLNPLYASEDLAGRVANEEISLDVAEEVIDNLGIGEVIDD